LLHALQALEKANGRERPYKNAPRTLDLDIIFHGDVVLNTPELSLPHPRWQARAFVVWPLAEVLPERVSADTIAAVQGQIISKIDHSDSLRACSI
jgi:2-amino-4-hydroxy-6-hydroxymethyldihydropteridine diphosphokinase